MTSHTSAPQQLTACSPTTTVHNSVHQHSYSKSESNGIWRALMMLCAFATHNLATVERFWFLLALCFPKTQAYAINRCNYEIDFTSLHTHAHLRNVFTNRCACGDAMCVYFRNKKMKKTHKKPDESYR